MFHVFVAICLFGGALARPSNKTCPRFEPVKNFDLTKFLGTWYEAEQTFPQPEVVCATMWCSTKFGWNRVVFQWLKIKTNGSLDGESDNPEHSLDASERTDYAKVDTLRFEIGDRVVATDYTSFAVSYFCDDPDVRDIGHIWTRDRFPTKDLLVMVHKIIKEKIGNLEFWTINQSACASPTQ